MKITTEFRPRDEGADIFIVSDERDPLWMMLRWDAEANRLAGYVGGRSRGSLPAVRPVTITDQEFSAANIGSAAVWAFIAASNLRGAIHEEAKVSKAAAQLDAWEAFLAGPGAASKPKPADDLASDEFVDLTVAQADWMTQIRAMKNADGLLTPIRRQGFRVGAMISGFQAIAVRRSVAEVFPQVPNDIPSGLAAAKKALSAVERPSSQAVHWYASAEGAQAVDRMQAAGSFPVLAGMIADNPILSRAVDSREALQPLLQERTGLSKGALKRIGKLRRSLPVGRLFDVEAEVRGEDALGVNRARRFTISGEISLDMALRHLADLPPDRVPQDDDSWMRYHDILAGCAIPLENALGVPVGQTLSACKGDWKVFHAQLAKAADFDPAAFDRRAIALCTTDAIEAIEDFSRTTVLPVALHSIASTDEPIPEVSTEFFEWAARVSKTICIGQSKTVAASLLEMARRYASRIPALNDATGYQTEEGILPDGAFAKYGQHGFPRLTDAYRASNGLVIRNLTTFDEMRLESDRLKHCVGRMYLDKARKANCHIFSIQSADGSMSYSTIELSGLRGETAPQAAQNLILVQHRSRENGAVDEECRGACSEWFAKLKGNQLWVNFDEILRWREFTATQQGTKDLQITWKGVIGMEWQDADRRQAAWEEWRYIMGGQFGKAPVPEAIFREKSARELVMAMNPKAAGILIQRGKDAERSHDEDVAPSLH